MENELKARITADISNFRQGINEAEHRLQRAQTVFERSSKAAFDLENALSKLGKQYKEGAISETEFSKQADQLNKRLQEQRDNVRVASAEIRRLQETVKVNDIRRFSSAVEEVGEAGNVSALGMRSANSAALNISRTLTSGSMSAEGFARSMAMVSRDVSRASLTLGGMRQTATAVLTSLITPANLLALGISALATVFSLYRSGVFSTKKEVDDLKKAQDSLNESLKETDKIARREFYNQMLRDLGILKFEVTETGRVLKDVFSDLTPEERLQKIADKIKTATKPELEVLESFLRGKLADSLRVAANTTGELEKTFADVDVKEYRSQLALVTKELSLYDDALDKTTKIKVSDIFNSKDFVAQTDLIKKAIQEGIITEQDGKRIKKIIADSIDFSDNEQLKAEMRGWLEKSIDGAIDGVKLDDKIVNVPIKLTAPPIQESTREADEALKKYEEMAAGIKKAFENAGKGMHNALSRSFEQSILSGENFMESVEKGFKRLLARLAAQLAASAVLKILGSIVVGPAGAALTAGVGGNIAGNLFGGFRASGGPVSAGKAYVVGERRPELFVPRTSGTIVPRLPDVNTGASAKGLMNNKMDIHVYGEVRNDSIAISNKRGSRNLSKGYGI